MEQINISINMENIIHQISNGGFIFVTDCLIKTKIKKSVYKNIHNKSLEMINYSLDEDLQFLWSEINSNVGFQMYLNQKNENY